MMKPLYTRSILGLGVASLAAVSGCAGPLARWDAQQGDAVRTLRAAQLIDPQAPLRNGNTLGAHDGKAAVETADRYVTTFREPPPQNIFIVGPASTGGGAAK